MKLNLLAIAIPALLVAAGANASIEVWNKDGNKVDFYGRVKAANNITDRAQKGQGDDTSARLGMSGQTQITDSVVGYGRWEYEADAGKDSHNEVRYAFAGLNFGDLGSFDYGRNDGVLKAITAYTDVLPQFGGDASNNTWNVLSSRTKAVATYRNNNFFGLSDDFSFALQYADNGDNSSLIHTDRINHQSREAYGANAQWRIFDTGLTAGAGYAQTTKKGTRHNTWAGGLKYENYDLYLGANYFQSKLKKADARWINGYTVRRDEKIRGFELVAQYGIDLEVGRLTPSLAYVQHKSKLDSKHFAKHNYVSGENSPIAKYVSLGATYDLNKNFSAIVEYKFNLLDDDDKGARLNSNSKRGKDKWKPGTKDVLGVGLIYQF
ncbi:Outer membrane protein (porin) [Gilliamella apicola]|uniref:porin n=1 Tax=Gilliamella apicola TaxID=1196095 RepID=UPI00042E9673|nr:porin [Gilliamella apicola]AHN26728.1 Outer membrane protein (porin) [Gilliamella apicola]PXV97198.1 outer membrane pore protein F/outer membrane protein N [Gilliamella apicola]